MLFTFRPEKLKVIQSSINNNDIIIIIIIIIIIELKLTALNYCCTTTSDPQY